MVNSPIVVGILQRYRSRILSILDGNEATFLIDANIVVIIYIRTTYHSHQSGILINIQTFGNGIGEHRHSVIANHTPVFIAGMRPYGQRMMNTLAVVCQHRLHHIGIALLLDDVHQRMESAVSVP